MRDFLNAILGFIGAASLTDGEFLLILDSAATQTYTLETFGALQMILDERESVTDAHTRLRYFFLARGVAVGETAIPSARSNIFLGGALED